MSQLPVYLSSCYRNIHRYPIAAWLRYYQQPTTVSQCRNPTSSSKNWIIPSSSSVFSPSQRPSSSSNVTPSTRFTHRHFSAESVSTPPPHSPTTTGQQQQQPVSYTSSPLNVPTPSLAHSYRRDDIEDAVMGILTRYTNKPIRDLELSSKLVDLETRTGHDSSYEQLNNSGGSSSTSYNNINSKSSSSTSNAKVATEQTDSALNRRRLWDCLDTVEFMLDVEKLFNIEIPDAVADAVETPQDAVDAVYNLLMQAGKIEVQKGC